MDPEVLENLLKGSGDYIQPDINTLQEENDRLRHALRTMVRKYNSTKRELEMTRISIGYYDKHFRFLELPREIRDQIYEYAFISPTRVVAPEGRLANISDLEDPDWLPATPGLLLVNRKISMESTEILYSKNGFKFLRPQDLLRFEETIGSSNRDRIQQIHIHLECQDKFPIQYMEIIPQYNWEAFPFYYSKALMRSKLSNVVDMSVSIINPNIWVSNNQEITALLEGSIKKFLSRNPKPKTRPRLVLNGFKKSECDKFPKEWDVIFEKADIEKIY